MSTGQGRGRHTSACSHLTRATGRTNDIWWWPTPRLAASTLDGFEAHGKDTLHKSKQPQCADCSRIEVNTLIHRSFVRFWHAPLWVRSAKHRHQSPEWTILSHVDCFVHGQVHWFQVLLNSLHPRTTGTSRWSPPVLQGGLIRSAWHLIRLAFAHCGRRGRDAVLEQ